MGNRAPTVITTIGINTLDGLGHIVRYKTTVDMGNHGAINFPVTLDAGTRMLQGISGECKFSYYNKKTGNVIYREVAQEERVH